MVHTLRRVLITVVIVAICAGSLSCSSSEENVGAEDQPEQPLSEMFDQPRPSPSGAEAGNVADEQTANATGSNSDMTADFGNVPETEVCQTVINFKTHNAFINDMTAELVRQRRRDPATAETEFRNSKPELLHAAQEALKSVQSLRELSPDDVAAALLSQQVLVQNALDSLLEAETFMEFANSTSNFARPMLADLIEAGLIYNPYFKDECQITLT